MASEARRIFKARIRTDILFNTSGHCKLLRSHQEVAESIAYLRAAGYDLHPCEPKNWDLAHILSEVDLTGNFLDMGSWESQVLLNLARRPDRSGGLYGVDLQQPHTKIRGVKTIVGDLMATGLPNKYFTSISCVSVIEHGVDPNKFAAEASRLLRPGGKLFVTFDYWDPKITAPKDLYGLPWRPFDRSAVETLIRACAAKELNLVEPMSWELGEPLIRAGYHSPEPSMSYTFGLVTFRKLASAA